MTKLERLQRDLDKRYAKKKKAYNNKMPIFLGPTRDDGDFWDIRYTRYKGKPRR